MQNDTVGRKFKKHGKQHYISYRDKNIKIFIGTKNITFRVVVILKEEQNMVREGGTPRVSCKSILGVVIYSLKRNSCSKP